MQLQCCNAKMHYVRTSVSAAGAGAAAGSAGKPAFAAAAAGAGPAGADRCCCGRCIDGGPCSGGGGSELRASVGGFRRPGPWRD